MNCPLVLFCSHSIVRRLRSPTFFLTAPEEEEEVEVHLLLLNTSRHLNSLASLYSDGLNPICG